MRLHFETLKYELVLPFAQYSLLGKMRYQGFGTSLCEGVHLEDPSPPDRNARIQSLSADFDP